MNLADLQTFSLVAETGTISAAAKQLGVPKSTVSRRVRRLEDALGHELLRRGPRKISLTEHGRVLHTRTRPALKDLDAAVEMIADAQTDPVGTLRITTTSSFGQSRAFLACVTSFGIAHPRVTTELELTNRIVDLVEENIDVALRLHAGMLPGNASLMSRRLARFTRAMYASPNYLEVHGIPQSLDDLAAHRIAGHGIVDLRGIRWHHRGALVNEPYQLPAPRWLVSDASALERLAVSGAGLVVLPQMTGDVLVSSGALQRVLPDYEHREGLASLVWPASRHLAPRVRAFIDHAVAHFADAPENVVAGA
jgi:DNA-binding transcriptional LysR family regulator